MVNLEVATAVTEAGHTVLTDVAEVREIPKILFINYYQIVAHIVDGQYSMTSSHPNYIEGP